MAAKKYLINYDLALPTCRVSVDLTVEMDITYLGGYRQPQLTEIARATFPHLDINCVTEVGE